MTSGLLSDQTSIVAAPTGPLARRSGTAISPAVIVVTVSVLARLPLAMFGIGLLVHTQHLTGSFTIAGLVTGSYAVAVGIGGPALGRLVDRFGQALVVIASASAAGGALAVIAALPRATPMAILIALAFIAGVATPPVGACARVLLPDLISDRGRLRAAYAMESAALELTFIFGPPLAIGIAQWWSTGAALAAGGLVLVIASVGFVANPSSRGWRPAPGQTRPKGGSLGSGAMRTLVGLLACLGVVFGAVEVGVTAAAARHGSIAAAGPLLAVWGIGSLVGGILATRFSTGGNSHRRLMGVLVLLAAAHASLSAVTGNTMAMALLLFLAGAAIAPTYAAVYAMVEECAPPGTTTEAFAWLATSVTVGEAIGTAVGGFLIDSNGPSSTFMLAGVGGALAVALASIRPVQRATTNAPPPEPDPSTLKPIAL